MGTRGLTMVVSKGKTRVAQYGQWDHYPSGQGRTALEFLRDADFKQFAKKLYRCKFIKRKKQKEIDAFLTEIGCPNGWMTGEQSKLYQEKFPYLTRDHGAGILELIYNSTDKEIWLHDQTNFASDSLFCEYAYVIDLDKRTFEIYSGFNKSNVDESERFAYLQGKSKNDYGVIHHMKTYSLDDLPTVDDYLKEMEQLQEVEED
jgi:hypothetical protein